MTESIPVQSFDASTLPRGKKTRQYLHITTMPDGNPLHFPLLSITGQENGPTLTVLAGVHGDEYEGIQAIYQVFGQLEPANLRGTLLMVPVVNLPAYMAATRSGPIDHLNLARICPGDPKGTISHQIAHWLCEKLIRPATLLLDLHSAGTNYTIPMMIGYPYSDDDLGKSARAAAEAFGAPVIWAHPRPSAPGRTISVAEAWGIPWLYTEAPGGGRVRPEDLACYINGTLNVISHLGMAAPRPRPQPPTHYLIGSGDLDRSISAPISGQFIRHVEVLESVQAGQLMGSILGLTGETLAEIHAPVSGVVIMHRGLARIYAGDGVFEITQRLPANG
ncbi:MAG: succinylglutamate desuccinylase/aspartoacylase family protein [Chloroflexi bacterium]|nr:succinylglutamate desuccinylase/aspartoacylase family protein [Chloroflexota bacterium]